MSSSKKDLCKDCPLADFCNKSSDPSIIERCNNLTQDKRLVFASDNNLIPKMDEAFAQIFWDFQDMSSAYIFIKMLKDNFENPDRVFPANPQLVKDQMYIELLMKFCKFAEDLGGLIISRDTDMYKFAQKYIQYKVEDVTSFYENLSLSEEEISEIFSYPRVEIQKSEEARGLLQESYEHIKDSLKEIRDDYLKYRGVYNSYKHGYRIRFKQHMEMTVDPRGNKEKKYDKVLLYYDKTLFKKNPFFVGMIAYEGYNDGFFNIDYDTCLATIKLIQVFLNNYRQFQKKSVNKHLILFHHPFMEDLVKESFRKDIEFVY